MARTDLEQLVFQMSADVRGLQKSFDRARGVVNKGSKDIENRAGLVSANLEKFFGKPSVPKALDKVFDSTRFRILDSGAARVGLFGSALEALGPIGLTVAGVLGSVGVAVHQSLAAMDLGDELGDTAAQLQVTTDTLQEYRYAIHSAGGETADADEAIRSFQEQLGKAQAGLQRNLKWFKALGFSQEQIKSFGSTEDALRAVIVAIGKLPSASERAAAASALGLQGLIPVINQGIDKFDELRAAAHRLGYVLDADTIQKLGDAKDRMEDASMVIKTQLAAAFSGTAVDIANAMSVLSQWIAKLREVANEAPGLFGAIRAAAGVMTASPWSVVRGVDAIRHAGQDRADPRAGPVTADQMRSFFAIPAPGTGGGANLELPGKDTSAADAKARESRRRQVEEQIYKATVDVLNIHNNERRAIEDRLVFTLDELDLERQRRKIQLDELEADYARSKGKEGISHAERLILEGKEEQVRSGKEFNAKEEAALALKDEQLRIEQQAAGFARDLLDVQEQLATTQAERRRIQLQILESERAIARKALEESLSRDANLTDEQRQQQLGAFDAVTAAQRRGIEANTRGPLEDYIAGLPKSVDELNERMQSLAVEGIKGLEDAIVDLATGAKSASDILRDLVRQLLADFTRMELQQLEGQIFKGGSSNGFINFVKGGLNFAAGAFGFGGGGGGNFVGNGTNPADVNFAGQYADGTDYHPGGLSIVGERGIELLNIPRGAQVIPNDILRGLSRIGRAGPAQHTFSPSLQVFVQGGGMSAADARRTGMQIGAAAMERMAKARKRGIAA